MTQKPETAELYAPVILPAVRKVRFADLREALAKGRDDFMHKPGHVVTLAFIYPIIGLILGRLTFGYDLFPLLFPLAAGFALLGPFAAIGFYEMSRARELGRDPPWWSVLNPMTYRSRGAILSLGALLMVIFLIWLGMAEYIFEDTFGREPVTTLSGFVHQVFETPQGVRLMIVGNLIGFIFALVCFSISVISFPLLLDRDVTAPVAIVTSLKAVITNPLPMFAWALFIALALIAGSLPLLLGLAVVLPVLGHSSWHLYRKLVV